MFRFIKTIVLFSVIWWVSLYYLLRGKKKGKNGVSKEIYQNSAYEVMMDREEIWVRVEDGKAMITNNCSLMDC